VLGTAVRLELVLRTFGEVLQVARENERSTTELLEASPDAADELLRRVATKLRAGAPPAG